MPQGLNHEALSGLRWQSTPEIQHQEEPPPATETPPAETPPAQEVGQEALKAIIAAAVAEALPEALKAHSAAEKPAEAEKPAAPVTPPVFVIQAPGKAEDVKDAPKDWYDPAVFEAATPEERRAASKDIHEAISRSAKEAGERWLRPMIGKAIYPDGVIA